MNSEIAIKLANVSKYYKLYKNPKDRLKEALNRSNKKYHKKFYATKGLSLEVKKGEILGIVGKNGSGKSTLLKLITGVLTPDEGTVEVNGKISALLELGSGFNPEFTGMQNIFFYGTILGFSKKEMEDKLEDIINFAEIGEFIDQPLKTYSSGMKSRLGFAVAVHIDPEILILDEVLSVGDILFKRKCYAKMEEFFNGGKTIIYVSHDGNSIKEFCTRAIFLESGNILIDSDAKSVTQLYEKYLFSSENEQNKIKLNIKNVDLKVITKNEKKKIDKKIIKEDNLDGDLYLPSLKSSPNFINEDIISFSNICMLNSKNAIVNNLQMNHNYKINFNINFHKNLKNIYFGIQILTIKGFLLSGANTRDYANYEVYTANRNDKFSISMKFNCFMLPGTYIVKLFCTDDNITSMVHDAFIFKVQSQKVRQGGVVTLNQEFIVN